MLEEVRRHGEGVICARGARCCELTEALGQVSHENGNIPGYVGIRFPSHRAREIVKP